MLRLPVWFLIRGFCFGRGIPFFRGLEALALGLGGKGKFGSLGIDKEERKFGISCHLRSCDDPCQIRFAG